MGKLGEKWLQLPVTPQVKPGSMHRLSVSVCVRARVCVHTVKSVCERSNVNCTPVNEKKKVLQTVHVWYVNLYFLFI